MYFSVLGTLNMINDQGEQVAIPQPRIRALLTILLLNANNVVTNDRITALLWGIDAPPGATHAIHSYTSALRKHLGASQRLRRASPGYYVVADEHELDLSQFQLLAAQGCAAFQLSDYAHASPTLKQAIELWRDKSLPDFPKSHGMQAAALRLVDEFHAARDMLFDARMALGEHRALIPELRTASLEMPGDERTWIRLMLALHRSDMRKESLEVFIQARKILEETSGIRPSTNMKRVHQKILIDDSALSDTSTHIF
jgi:DNA-binding SARP family transcriptional activator